jgi:hypothetical protein
MTVQKRDLAPGDPNPRIPDAPTDGYGFECECGFASSGWPQRKHANARWQQHKDEHEGNGVTQSLDDFRREHGLEHLRDE